MAHAMELDSMAQHHHHLLPHKEYLYLQQRMYKPEESELISTSRDQLVQRSNLMNVKLMAHAMELDSMAQHHHHLLPLKEYLYLQQQMYKPEESELISTSRDQLVQRSNLMNVKLMDHAMELDSMAQHH